MGDDQIGSTLKYRRVLLKLSGEAFGADGETLSTRVLSGIAQEIKQVLLNLITNALDAMKEVDEPELSVTVERDGDVVRLIVEDNGTGLPSKHREEIFDPFFTTKDVGEGLGLGLSISFNILKDFGGSIAAENRAGGGARFTLALQAAEPPSEDAGPTGAREAAE